MKGFTLIELMVTLALLVVLGLIADSSFSVWIKRNDQRIAIDEIKAAVQYAKTQAILRDHPVFLSPLAAQDWSIGMILNYTNPKTRHTERLYQWQWHHPQLSTQWHGLNATEQIVFSNHPIHAISNGKFIIHNLRTHERQTIVLNRLGRIRVDE